MQESLDLMQAVNINWIGTLKTYEINYVNNFCIKNKLNYFIEGRHECDKKSKGIQKIGASCEGRTMIDGDFIAWNQTFYYPSRTRFKHHFFVQLSQ